MKNINGIDMEESSKPPLSKKKKKIIIGSILTIIIVIFLLFYLLSPSLSPLSQIRDTDGDGHPDSSDFMPNDPLFWDEGSATIIVTITSNHITNSIHFTLYLNDVMKAEGDLAPGASTIKNIICTFPIGQGNTTAVTVLATATGGAWGDTSASASGLVLNGDSYPIYLTV